MNAMKTQRKTKTEFMLYCMYPIAYIPQRTNCSCKHRTLTIAWERILFSNKVIVQAKMSTKNEMKNKAFVDPICMNIYAQSQSKTPE